MTINFKNLYENGVIASWYLRPGQLKLYEMLRQNKKVVAKAHRRYGKGTTVLVHIFERCLTEKIIVRYGTTTQRHAHHILIFLRDKIFLKYPDLAPQYKSDCYVFPSTGSKIYCFGCSDSQEADKARGAEAHIIICDEYAFFKYNASYVLKAVLLPQLLETNGQIIITSTPPPDITHDYVHQVIEAGATGNLINWTILDSLKIGDRTQEDYNQIVLDCGGEETETFKREYMCELIASSERLVIPEASKKEDYIGRQERSRFYDYYICMDLGLRDKTAVLFAYLDFEKNIVVIERELYINYRSTAEIVEECRRIEEELKIKNKIYKRMGDCELQQLFDMSKDHDYKVSPIVKRSKQTGQGYRDSILNNVRLSVSNNKFIVDSDACPNTIKQLKFGIWNASRTDFERTETMGHLDALMALAYLLDNISWTKNPYPLYEGPMPGNDTFVNRYMMEVISNKNKILKMIGK